MVEKKSKDETAVVKVVKIVLSTFLLAFFLFSGNGAACDQEDVGLHSRAELDGKPWEGRISFSLEPEKWGGYLACREAYNTKFSEVPVSMSWPSSAHYLITYLSGGPAGASFSGIRIVLKEQGKSSIIKVGLEPSGSYDLHVPFIHAKRDPSRNYRIYFVFESHSEVLVDATLDDKPWSGEVSYKLQGPEKAESGASVPENTTELPPGSYTTTYISGGPPGAVFQGISPSPTEELSVGETTTFTLNFISAGEIAVNTTLDGEPWSGEVGYQLQGLATESGSSTPQTFSKLPAGSYSIDYLSGGPEDAILRDISPSDTQELSNGEITTFTFNFASTGNIAVDAMLDGEPWSGEVNYQVRGPESESGSSAPRTFSELPVGSYSIDYLSGGPEDAMLRDISPSVTGDLSNDETFAFTLNFISVGEILVNATLNGEPWSGDVNYQVQGPGIDSGSSTPQSFTELPIGPYNIDYLSGGPEGAMLRDISPSDTEELSTGDMATFTLNFISTGDISVEAIYVDKPWAGEISYTIMGPVMVSGNSVPQFFSDLPVGTYRIIHNSGQPPGASFFGILPSSKIILLTGETSTFTLIYAIPVIPVTPVSSADLSLDLQVDDTTVAMSIQFANYTVTVTNSGPSTATGIRVNIPVPGNYDSHVAGQGTYNTGTGIWTIGDINSGANAVLQIRVTFSDAPGTIVDTTVEVTAADQTDPDSMPNNHILAEDDQDEVSITVIAMPD